MAGLEQIYSFGLLVAIIISFVTILFTFKHRNTDEGKMIFLLMISATFWIVAQLGATIAPSVDIAYRFSQATYLGITVTIASFFLFTIAYTGYTQYLKPRYYAILSIEPILMQILVWTNGYHHFIWVDNPATPGYMDSHAIGWFIHAIYSYILILIALYLLVHFVVREQTIFKQQGTMILLAAIFPLGANFYTVILGYTPFDLTPIGYVITGGVLSWSITQQKLISVTPIARKQVIEEMESGMIVVDENGAVIEMNERAKEILRTDIADTIGRQLEDLSSIGAELMIQYGDREDVVEISEIETKDRKKHYKIEISTMQDSRDRFVGRVIMMTDLTEQINRQQELKRKNEQLEQFASLVSHDLRNPLTLVGGYAEQLETRLENDPTGQEYVREIQRAYRRMDTLVNDILTLARQRETVEDKERIAVREVVTAAWGMVETTGMDLVIEENLIIQGDFDRLQQMFENLIRNTRDHAGSDVTVTVGGVNVEGDHDIFNPEKRGFYFEDNGDGIPQDERSKVLEEGYTTDEDGTGLGLTIVQQIVESHGWELQLAQSSSGGARFEILDVEKIEKVQEESQNKEDQTSKPM